MFGTVIKFLLFNPFSLLVGGLGLVLKVLSGFGLNVAKYFTNLAQGAYAWGDKLMATYGFYDAIAEKHQAGMAVWGTCAGAILIARDIIDALPDQRALALMDISVRRNAYGRQIDSFEADLDVRGLDGGPFRGVFIRAPWIESVGDGVEVLAEHDGHIVAARQGRLLATAFHPELTGDPRVHAYFLAEVAGEQG